MDPILNCFLFAFCLQLGAGDFEADPRNISRFIGKLDTRNVSEEFDVEDLSANDTSLFVIGNSDSRNASQEQDVYAGFWERLNPGCECGSSNKNHKIVGGQLTEENEYPWLVSLHFASPPSSGGLFESQFCGASLISSRWVLTAAHCVYDFRTVPAAISLLFGGYDLNAKSDPKKVIMRSASRIVTHPHYNAVTMDSDLALIRLDKPVKSADHVRPVCLPTSAVNAREQSTKEAIVVGWGALAEDEAGSPKPMEVSVPLVPNDVCQKYYTSAGMKITPKMLCAGAMGKDSCQGDSGGPLVYEGQHGSYMVVGVVSFGIGCARKDYPGVYAQVISFLPWIRWMTGNEVCFKAIRQR